MVAETRPPDHEVWILPLEWFQETNERSKQVLKSDLVALAQLGQATTRIAKQIRLLGVLGRAYIKVARNGSRYIIFKGLSGARPNLRGTRYLAENPKVACFVVGAEDILKDAAKGTRVAVIAFVAIDIMKECLADQFSWASLGVNVGSDIVQAVLATGVGVVAGVLASTAGAPVVIAFAIVVGIGFLAGMSLSAFDTNHRLTECLRARMMAMEQDPKSAMYRLEHRMSEVSTHAVELAKQEFSAAAYQTNRFWHSIESMFAFDRAQTRALAAPTPVQR